MFRLLYAYYVTVRVTFSYLWFSLWRRFRSPQSAARVLRKKHQRNARRVEAAIIRLRGMFIKIGQLISIMANVLPDAFRDELQRLQDQVPSRPSRDMEARFREEFGGRTTRDLFAEFDEKPVASASIAQVHRARLASGQHVAVKVQYSDIEKTVKADLRALRRIFGMLGWLMPDYGFDVIYREIREMVIRELDFRQEAAAIERIAVNLKQRPDVGVPRVIPECSTMRVLTTEWVDGVKVSDLVALDAQGIDRRQVARTCLESYCQQIFVDGLYHADPHPGNLLVRATPTPGAPQVVFLDFGATSTVSAAMRRGMISFLQGAMTRDTSRIVTAMKDMGFISRRADPEVFDRVVEYFHDKFRVQLKFDNWTLKDLRFDPEQTFASLLDLRELNVSLADLRDAFHIPKEWILLERTLLLLLGVCTTLDPEMNPTPVIRPYLERFLLGEKKEWTEAAAEAARETALSALAVPAELNRLLARALRGELEVRVSHLEESALAIYDVGRQLLWGLLTSASAMLSVFANDRGHATLTAGAAIASGVFGVFLLWSLPRRRRFRRR